jgi:hypothetical protein
MLSAQLITWQTTLRARLDALQASLDRLLIPAEGMPAEAPAEGEKKGLPTWAIILIIVGGVLLVLCCVVACIVFVLPQVFGPAIGNVFDNVINQMQ